MRFVVAWDEFQEVGRLGGGPRGAEAAGTLALVRIVWQRHRRVAYVISGSARGMLRELTTSARSPFFQHFSLMDLGPLSSQDAVRLLVRASADVRPIPPRLARRAVEVLGGHPFHLQLLGESLIAQLRPLNESALKAAIQELLFSRSGRLSLYFENEFQGLVGRSTRLAAVLRALADGAKRVSELARAIGAPAGATVRYVERLGDAVRREDGGTYRLDDPVFGLWLRWRKPGGTVVPMTVVGDEAEVAVASHLARSGFDVVYQARASRGPFDLLATRADRQLAVQVRRMALPLRFPSTEWDRMVAEEKRLGWDWVVAAVARGGAVVLLDPRRATRRKGVTLGESARIDNILLRLGTSASSRGRGRGTAHGQSAPPA